MSNEIVFANGIIFKLPRAGAPDFVKGSLSFKVEDAIVWLKENESGGWCNVNLKVSRAGKPYADLDNWKPNNQVASNAKNVNSYQSKANDALKENGFDTEDVPF